MNASSCTPAQRKQKRASLSSGARVKLINQVLDKARKETESWTDRNLGAQLAYLALVITDDLKGGAFVEWDVKGDSDTAHARRLFEQWFSPIAMVWFFIEPAQ